MCVQRTFGIRLTGTNWAGSGQLKFTEQPMESRSSTHENYLETLLVDWQGPDQFCQ